MLRDMSGQPKVSQSDSKYAACAEAVFLPPSGAGKADW